MAATEAPWGDDLDDMSDLKRPVKRHPGDLPLVTTLRLPVKAMEWLEELRVEHRISRTAVIRCCINVARAHPTELMAKIGDIS